ncbi:MAG: hypothetical protein GKR89_05470 [Candidatus Latescibacteria bacterium]|nr:hypothetical protein [Candidatus Latescibacterota bacterium]
MARVLLLLVPLLTTALVAEQLVFSRADDWTQWTHPAGALQVEDGRLSPRFFRKQINASLQATIRAAGTNANAAAAIIDGDAQTGWSPDPDAPLERWWVEIDLGQVLPIQRLSIHFDENVDPFAFFKVSLSDGERFINNANVVVDGTLLYNDTKLFSFNEQHRLQIDLDEAPIRVIRFEVSRRQAGPILSEIGVEAYGDNIAFDLLQRGGNVDVEAAVVALAGTPIVMFDGDLVTAWRVNPLAKGSTGGGETFGDYRIDLGASYWIDTIWLLGDPIGIPPRVRHNYANFLSYQLLYSDGSRAPDGTLSWNQLVTVPSDPRNLLDRRNVHHQFAPVAARYLRLFYPTSQGEAIIGGGIDGGGARYDGLGLVGEFQVYGQGHPQRAVLQSPVIDLGTDWNITALQWQAQTPPGSTIRFRSRSGNEVVEEIHYFDKNGKELTQRRWEKLIKSFRGPVESILTPGAEWSPWSESYTRPGTPFGSPSPRRYFQLEAEFTATDPMAAAILEALTVEYTRPLASQALGEIAPQQVQPGLNQTFSYFLRPSFTSQSLNFDQIALRSSVPMDFRDLLVDGNLLAADHQPIDRGFRLQLAEPITRESLLELRFDAVVLQNNTRFLATLERAQQSTGDTLRQQVDPGDAAFDLEGTDDVVSLPITDNLFAHLHLQPRLFTPNGDSRNDHLSISVDILKLRTERPIRARIYDLQGRLIRQLSDTEGRAGHRAWQWDGRDQQDRAVPPGLYLFHLEIKGDAQTQTITRTVGLSY